MPTRVTMPTRVIMPISFVIFKTPLFFKYLNFYFFTVPTHYLRWKFDPYHFILSLTLLLIRYFKFRFQLISFFIILILY
jgi:hypothetical protein